MPRTRRRISLDIVINSRTCSASACYVESQSEDPMMRKSVVLSAAASSALTLFAVWSLRGAALPSKVKLENARVRVTEVTAAAGSVRERGVRETDQIIVFLDDCRYERTDPATGQKTVRER